VCPRRGSAWHIEAASGGVKARNEVEVAMFEEEERPRRAPRFTPLPLDGLGVEELRDYIASLGVEIARAEAAIAARERQRGAADAVFRRPGSDPGS
jgi:uncharacterized small protein (DUF1192 family)